MRNDTIFPLPNGAFNRTHAAVSGRDGLLQEQSGVDAGGPGNQSREESTQKREDRTVSMALYVIEHTGRIPLKSQALLRGRLDGKLAGSRRGKACLSGRRRTPAQADLLYAATGLSSTVHTYLATLTRCQCGGRRVLSPVFPSEPAGLTIGHSCGPSVAPPGPTARKERDSLEPCASR